MARSAARHSSKTGVISARYRVAGMVCCRQDPKIVQAVAARFGESLPVPRNRLFFG